MMTNGLLAVSKGKPETAPCLVRKINERRQWKTRANVFVQHVNDRR
jgi:hypothetical protein